MGGTKICATWPGGCSLGWSGLGEACAVPLRYLYFIGAFVQRPR